MKWTNERSSNVEDRRGRRGGKALVGGGIGTLIIAVIVYFMGDNPMAVLNSADTGMGAQRSSTTQEQLSPAELKNRELVQMIAAWNEETWADIFEENGMTFKPAKIVMFSQATQSGCGAAQAAMGPFYCPADQTVYVDMSFFNELHARFGAKVTQFTIAYVLGHEMGHHVQTLLGTTQKVDQMRRSGRYAKADMNRVSVAVELQADFYAGVWAKRNNQRVQGGVLEPGDIEAAVSAAQAVGDDNIQKRAQGYINQEAFTHGSSKQRVTWFLKGYRTGDIRQGDTFETLLGMKNSI